MDSNRFDDLTRRLGSGLNRRQLVRALIGGVSGMLAVSNRSSVQAQDPVDCIPACTGGSICNALGQCVSECYQAEGPCTTLGDCCMGYSCIDNQGTFTCQAICAASPGAPCSPTGLNCCENAGLTCTAGACCRTQGGTCNVSGECCGDLICDGATQRCAVAQSCAQETQSCTQIDCCTGLVCSETTHTCHEPCARDADCGVDEVCCDGGCRTCCEDHHCPLGDCSEATCLNYTCDYILHDDACTEPCQRCTMGGTCASSCGDGEICCDGNCVEGTCCTDIDCYVPCGRRRCGDDHQCGGVTSLCPPTPPGTFECCEVGPGEDYCYGTSALAEYECCADSDCVIGAAACLVGICVSGMCEAGLDDSACGPGDCCCDDGSCSNNCCDVTSCDDDRDCPKGECCCKDGSCSRKCCGHKPGKPDKPGKPGKPHYPDKPSPGTIDTLPSTGSGPGGGDTSSWISGAALAAGAAAFLAAKKAQESDKSLDPDAD